MVKTTSTDALFKPVKPVSASSMRYRPRDYFGRGDLQTTLLTQVKGTIRRQGLRDALETGQVNDIPDGIKNAALSDDVRQFAGRIHPSFMGGEYLPNLNKHELEIARIRIESTTGDVTSVYARPVGQRIAYRVVDEYDCCFSGRSQRTSIKPLTMGELIEFFLGAWDLHECLNFNFGSDVHAMLGFFEGESEFYPCFDSTLRQLVRQKFSES
jgi:hypothetical protein